MTDMVLALGKRITERWLSAVALPGLLYAAVVLWAAICGQAHALDGAYASARIRTLTGNGHDTGTIVLLLLTIAGAAMLVGAVASVIAERAVHRWWIRDASPAKALRLKASAKEHWSARDPAPPSRYLPTRATVVGEHFRLLGERVDAQYGLSIVHVWPRLWLQVDPDVRKLITAAHRQYFCDAGWAAWGLLYLPWTIWWWPAALPAVAGVVVGSWRARDSSRIFATLLESAVDVHQVALAAAVGIDLPEQRITPEIGNQINDILTKRA